jgi:molybdenum cofactor cytidylyltransferase
MQKPSFNLTAVILASGMSSRMKTTKQLLPIDGVPLLEYCVHKILKSPFAEILSIVGHDYEKIKSTIQIKDHRYKWHYNSNYHEGQSSALKSAVSALHNTDGMMVFLADQPLIETQTIEIIYNRAIELLSSDKKNIVIQPSRLGMKGHPVFFSSDLFPAFTQLDGDEGGKKIIRNASYHEVIEVMDAGIIFDVDTPDDYRKLIFNKVKE